jgi:hydrogenase nickel incorporation protein HypA/HybF
MHEYSLVAALVGEVESLAQVRDGAAVRRLHVRLGELSGVDRTLFETAYATFREGSVCRDAELVVEPVSACWRCPRCATPIPRGELLRCAACGVPARLEAGDDLILERVELEVP